MSLVVGGVVPTEDVVGRVRESTEVLASLPHSGVVLVGDRRHGKTSLSRLVQRLAADQGAVVVSVSAERETYAEFVSALISELARLDPAWATELAKIRLTLTAGPVRLERDSRAAATLDDLLHRAIRRTGGRILALFIDEVSVLARNLERAQPGAGDTFLHLLRRVRQENPGQVATVLSGSIGFHHVSSDAPSTVNDIPKIAVGPIRSDHATYLAECLLMGTATPTTDQHDVGAAIAAAAENVPYYIQHLVAAARKSSYDTQMPVYPELIELLVLDAIENPYDPWDLRHYRDRLPHYYGADAPAIAGVLDVYAHANRPLDVDTVLMRLRSEGSPITDRAQLVSFVERLTLDHYLTRAGSDPITDRFSSPLVLRAWKAMRR
ncbi:ATP-binding protein [Mycobacterium sp. ITM-2016-00317]|uniref:ATP-binding protein n=1 Tax=Mycobacterium sp. ITM-2016-00317 TaxID=2099694 RepID=UPI00287F544C|nr:ATP-binding protein [Mycobacterium sp. ITM-2016-00317]WNG90435.1 ATP-binding protein [Mycobacterium sp. ITM-2016-00317]